MLRYRGLERTSPKLGGARGRRGRQWDQLEKMMMEEGMELAEGEEVTWERVRGGRLEQSRIDLAWVRDTTTPPTTQVKLSSDHWALAIELPWNKEKLEDIREAVDWDQLEREIVGQEDRSEEEQKEWVQ